jgi:hypothetical protein
MSLIFPNQIDKVIVIPTAGVTLEVHVPVGQNPIGPADAPVVVPNQAGVSVLGAPIKPVRVTIAGNIKFSNPA